MTFDSVGQGRAVANALLAMGGIAVIAAGVALALGPELKFVDATGMAGFGALMVATGLWQHVQVRAAHRPAPPSTHL